MRSFYPTVNLGCAVSFFELELNDFFPDEERETQIYKGKTPKHAAIGLREFNTDHFIPVDELSEDNIFFDFHERADEWGVDDYEDEFRDDSIEFKENDKCGDWRDDFRDSYMDSGKDFIHDPDKPDEDFLNHEPKAESMSPDRQHPLFNRYDAAYKRIRITYDENGIIKEYYAYVEGPGKRGSDRYKDRRKTAGAIRRRPGRTSRKVAANVRKLSRVMRNMVESEYEMDRQERLSFEDNLAQEM